MIGMMNSGNDVPVEFYSSPKRSSLYEQRIRRETLTYTEDGRILLDGNLKFQQTPEELWQDLLMRMVCNSVRKSLERSRTKSKMRRLFEQLSFQSTNDPPTITTADDKDVVLPSNSITSSPQSSPATSYSSTTSSSTAPYVTTIEIH